MNVQTRRSFQNLYLKFVVIIGNTGNNEKVPILLLAILYPSILKVFQNVNFKC